MADVSPWLVVFSTVATGAVAIASNWIEPKKDRAARIDAKRRARQEMLLSKAEIIFTELEIAGAFLDSLPPIERRRVWSEDDDGLLNSALGSCLRRSDALCITYFPASRHIVYQNQKDCLEVAERWSDRIKLGFKDQGEEKLARLDATLEFVSVQSDACIKMRAFLLTVSSRLLDD